MASLKGVGRTALLGRLVEAGTAEQTAQRLAALCADVAGVESAAIVLMDGSVTLEEIPATDPVAAQVGRLQRDRLDGPAVDAFRFGQPVYEPNLLAPHVVETWPVFQPAAVELGVRAAFALPLQVGTCRLGAITLQSDISRALCEAQEIAALTMAAIAAQAILVLKSGPPPGRLSIELQSNAEYNVVVNQAAGMVSAQCNVSIAEALIRMRSYSFGNDLALVAVARRVVARRLRFDP